MKSEKIEYPLVKVYWSDSNRWDRQYDVKFDFEITRIISIGYLIQEDKEKIVIARDCFPVEKEVRGVISIPKVNIISRELIAP